MNVEQCVWQGAAEGSSALLHKAGVDRGCLQQDPRWSQVQVSSVVLLLLALFSWQPITLRVVMVMPVHCLSVMGEEGCVYRIFVPFQLIFI